MTNSSLRIVSNLGFNPCLLPRFLFFLFLIFSNLESSVYGQSSPPISKHPVDISFVIIDLKYNELDGVKICEMQPGSMSIFSGYDFLNGADGLVADLFCDAIAKYQCPVWFIKNDICDKKFQREFLERGWKAAKDLNEVISDVDFLNAASIPIDNPFSLYDYHGILYARGHHYSVEEFRNRYPGIILLDAALFPNLKDKYVMDKLLQSTPKLKKIRPVSKVYPKQYSNELAQTILQDINSDILVIKPINSTKGQGVIILPKEDLDSTLHYVIGQPNKRNLMLDPDPSYCYWAHDHNHIFLVEQFIESDPVSVPQFKNKLYDGTMRAVILLLHHHRKTDLVFLECHWKLPKISISGPGTFAEKHKSYGKVPHFLEVDPQVLEKVQQQITEAFNDLYPALSQEMPDKLGGRK
jgi:hypothetical protein